MPNSSTKNNDHKGPPRLHDPRRPIGLQHPLLQLPHLLLHLLWCLRQHLHLRRVHHVALAHLLLQPKLTARRHWNRGTQRRQRPRHRRAADVRLVERHHAGEARAQEAGHQQVQVPLRPAEHVLKG